MSVGYTPTAPRRPWNLRAIALSSVAGLAAVAVGLGLGTLLSIFPVPLGAGVAGGIVLLVALILALANYERAAALGFLGLGVVFVEPAPVDLIFAVVITVAIVTGRFSLARVPVVVWSLLMAFLALNLLSATSVIDLGLGLRYFAITLYLAIFALWLTSHVHSRTRARTLVLAYVAGAALFAALASLAVNVPFPGSDQLVLFDRARGLFKDPNVFGPFLVPPALFVAAEMLEPRSKRLTRLSTRVLLLLFATVVSGIVFSYSRGAWLNLALSMLVMITVIALRRGGASKAMRFLAVAVSAAAVVGMVLSLTSSVDFLRDRARLQHYDASRFEAQNTGIGLIEQYPFGLGPGQFEPALPDTPAAHSLYVRALAEEGIVGLAVIVALVLATLAMALRNAMIGRDTYGIGSATLLGAWCGLVANSFVIDTLHWRHLWFVAALVWAGSMRRFVRPRSLEGAT